MLFKATHASVKRRARALTPSARPALTFFFLLAFLIQGYTTQTHIHPTLGPEGVVSADLDGQQAVKKISSSRQGDRERLPAKDGSDTCPICQQIAVAGAFVSPAFLALLVPAPSGHAPLIEVLRSVTGGADSHSWYSRGPPAH